MSDNQYKLEIQKLIQEIQEKVDIHMLNYNGIDYWPILRTQIAFNIIHSQKIFKKKSLKNKNKLIRFIKIFYKSIFSELIVFFKDRKSTEFFYKKSDIFYLSNSNARQNHKGKMTSIFFGPMTYWAKSSGKNITFFSEEFFYNFEIKTPRNEKSKLIETALFFYKIKAAIIKKLYCKNIKNNASLLDDIDKILKKHNQQSINRKQLKKSLIYINLISKRYEKILKKINPKLVMVADYYGAEGYALIHASNKLKIETFDVQHGVQGEFHPAYMALPINEKKGWNSLPKYFLCWNNSSSNYINSWGKEHHKAITFGNVWHAFLQEPRNKDEKSIYIKKIQEKIKNKSKIILFTLQPIHNIDHISNQITNLVIEKKFNEYFWLIRLHPYMFKKESSWLKKFKNFKNVDIENTSRVNLIYLLNICDIHITKFSSVTIEAAEFNKKTLLIDPDEKYYTDLRHTGLIYQRKNGESLSDSVIRTIEGKQDKKENIIIDAKQEFLKLLDNYFD